MITPIGQVNTMPKDAKVPAIEGTITRIYPDPKIGSNYRFESVVFKGSDGQECKVKFSSFEPLTPAWVGVPVRLSGNLTVDEFQGKRTVMIPKGASLEWNPPGYGSQPPAQNYGPPASQYAPPQQQGPPPPSYGPPSDRYQNQQQAPAPTPHHGAPASLPEQTGPKPILGQTVGMAVKCAVDLLSRDVFPAGYLQSPDFSRDLFNLASDILRVSHKLETGHLAHTVLTRNAPAPAQQQAPAQRRQSPGPAPMGQEDVEF